MIEELASFLIFVGRFHHVVNHFPIALILLSFLFELASRSKVFRYLKPTISPILLLAAISAVFASVIGYILYQAGNYEGDLVILHMRLGIAVSVTAFIAYFIRVMKISVKAPFNNVAYLTFLTITAGTVVIAGYQGGSLSHGREHLTEYMPQTLRNIAGLPPREPEAKKITNPQEAFAFKEIVAPIFQLRCLICHKTESNKGGLSLMTPDDIQIGGESGPVLVPGNSEMSELVRRISLPLDDENRMPKGKSPLSDNQVQLISWWIDEGASFDSKVKNLNVPENIQLILGELKTTSISSNNVSFIDVQPPDTNLVEELQDNGFQIWRIAQNSNLLRFVYVRFGDSQFSDEELKQLLPLSTNIAWLDIGGSEITDLGMKDISKFKNLERLHLEKTSITDNGLGELVSLQNLSYLNLYGTNITDTGLESISQMKSLESVYLWNTQVTNKGVTQLRKKLPNLNIESSIVISAIKRDAGHISKS